MTGPVDYNTSTYDSSRTLQEMEQLQVGYSRCRNMSELSERCGEYKARSSHVLAHAHTYYLEANSLVWVTRTRYVGGCYLEEEVGCPGEGTRFPQRESVPP